MTEFAASSAHAPPRGTEETGVVVGTGASRCFAHLRDRQVFAALQVRNMSAGACPAVPRSDLLPAYEYCLTMAWPTLQKVIAEYLSADPIIDVDTRRGRMLVYPGDQVQDFIAALPARERKPTRRAHRAARRTGALLLFLRDDEEHVLLARVMPVCQECPERDTCPERYLRQCMHCS